MTSRKAAIAEGLPEYFLKLYSEMRSARVGLLFAIRKASEAF